MTHVTARIRALGSGNTEELIWRTAGSQASVGRKLEAMRTIKVPITRGYRDAAGEVG